MTLNGFREPASRYMTSHFQAALNFRDYRLPELFCGVQRREQDASRSNIPSLVLAASLGIRELVFDAHFDSRLRPSAPRKELNIFNPQLPKWLDQFQIRNLRIGNSRVDWISRGRGERTFCNVVHIAREKMWSMWHSRIDAHVI